MKDLISAVFNIFRYTGRILTFLRNCVVNLVFIIICVVIGAGLLVSKQPPEIADGSILVLSLKGDIVEEPRHPTGFDRYVDEYLGFEGQPRKIVLQDVLDIVRSAAEDQKISMLLLDLKDLGSAGLNQMQDIGKALEAFKESGKKVIAAEDFYTQKQYFIASHADTVIVNSMGGVELHGFGTYNLYINQLVRKLKVNYHVFRVGTYKSAIEPLTRDSMSNEAREQNREWLGEFWDNYMEVVAEQRNLTPDELTDYIENISSNLLLTGGDTAQLALNSGLVDNIFTRGELRDFLKIENQQDPEEHVRKISTSSYLAHTDFSYHHSQDAAGAVGIIIAEGNIVGGKQPAGVIGGESLSEKIRIAKNDSLIEAVVIRISSGGGSAFASEVIRQEILEFKKSGKPLIVSMGSMAASGGYWVASAADKIYASPSTLTGSIGIFGAIPTFEDSLAEIGIHSDGVGTTSLSAGLNLTQPLPPALRESIQLTVNNGYETFLSVVAAGRNMTRDKVAQLAEGRVYSGGKALELGLVDALGNLEDAIAAAADLAGLEDAPAVYIEHQGTIKDKILQQFTEVMVSLNPENRTLRLIFEEISRFLKSDMPPPPLMGDPKHIYAHSMLKLSL